MKFTVHRVANPLVFFQVHRGNRANKTFCYQDWSTFEWTCEHSDWHWGAAVTHEHVVWLHRASSHQQVLQCSWKHLNGLQEPFKWNWGTKNQSNILIYVEMQLWCVDTTLLSSCSTKKCTRDSWVSGRIWPKQEKVTGNLGGKNILERIFA